MAADITAIILTKNEEVNIEECIKSIITTVKRIVVIDSFSTDKTVEIAKRMGAEVYQHPFENYLYNKSFNEDDLQKTHLLAKKYIKFSKKAYELYNKELKHISPQKNIGLYLRGTDYINLKPIGEPIQPTVAQAIEHVNTYIENEKNANVFLVTEDERIYKEVKSNLGERIVIVSFDNYIKNYSERDFLANGHSLTQLGENAHIRGLNYLVKIMLLSNCKYIVGGKTCGSWAACMLADESTKIDIFELGNY